MPNHKLLRLAATLLAGGFLTYVVVTLLHTGGPANDHPVIFDSYHHSQQWGGVHLGQFVGMAMLVAGLVTLQPVLASTGGASADLARLGGGAAAIALALYGALQAVDGVALKQAVDAWAQAPAAEKADRFANAETVRWLEWGVHSYHAYVLGLALVLVGLAIARSRTLPAALGYLAAFSGLPFLVQGWVLGAHGFDDDNTMAILASYVLLLAWVGWLTVLAWRRTAVAPAEVPYQLSRA